MLAVVRTGCTHFPFCLQWMIEKRGCALIVSCLQLVNALASAMAAADSHEAAAGGSESWVVKEALRTHTSEEPEGWKLSTAVDHGSQH